MRFVFYFAISDYRQRLKRICLLRTDEIEIKKIAVFFSKILILFGFQRKYLNVN